MSIHDISGQIDLIDASPPIHGYQKFISVYVIRDETVSIVDTGPKASLKKVLAGLKKLGIDLFDVSYVFLTHIHLDHAGGVGDLIDYLPNASVLVHEKGAPHLENPSRLWESTKTVLRDLADEYGKMKPVPKDRLIIGYDGDRLSLGKMMLRFLNTPGHASHHRCFLEERSRILFVGEAAGTYVKDIGMTRPATPFPFNLDYSLKTLEGLVQLRPSSLCYAHFGLGNDAVGKLEQYRQQLVLWAEIISEKMDSPHEKILRCLINEDKNLNRIEDLSENINKREHYYSLNSVNGFIKYFEKYGKYSS